VEDLRAAPVGYWALGHIHLRNDSNSLGDGRWWAYSGNLQGRNFKPAECHPKGALLVTLNRNGFDAPKFVACDTVRFQNIQIDVSEIDEFDDCSRLLIKEVLTASNSLENRRLVVRVELIGRSFLHKEIRTQVENGKMQKDFLGDFKSEIGSTIVAGITSTVKPTYDLNELRQEQGLIGTTLRILDQMSDEEVLAESKKLVVATASECLGDDDAVAIRERTAMALVEAILEGNKKS
jgi:DNA repair exonuclease SbcCD nuclease subunit